jgi:hypothetical protein
VPKRLNNKQHQVRGRDQTKLQLLLHGKSEVNSLLRPN